MSFTTIDLPGPVPDCSPPDQGFDLIHYAPVPEVYVGCGFAEWRVAA